MIFYALVFIFAAVAVYYRHTIVQGMTWIRNKYERIVFIARMLNNIAESQKPAQASFVINDSDQSATVVYKHNGMNYSLFVPFDRSYAIKMASIQAQLLHNDGTKVDITQEPGIPYLCKASELDGKSITVYNMNTGTTHTYLADCAPGYCLEAL